MSITKAFGNAALQFANRVTRTYEGRDTLILLMAVAAEAATAIGTAIPIGMGLMIAVKANPVISAFVGAVAGVTVSVYAERPLLEWAEKACEQPMPE